MAILFSDGIVAGVSRPRLTLQRRVLELFLGRYCPLWKASARNLRLEWTCLARAEALYQAQAIVQYDRQHESQL